MNTKYMEMKTPSISSDDNERMLSRDMRKILRSRAGFHRRDEAMLIRKCVQMGNIYNNMNENMNDDNEYDSDFECNGRACGNRSCGLEWSECEVVNIRLSEY